MKVKKCQTELRKRKEKMEAEINGYGMAKTHIERVGAGVESEMMRENQRKSEIE